MTLCYLGLGSNLQNPPHQLRLAIIKLQRLPLSRVIKVAPFYKNKAHGRKVQPLFYNTVVAIKTLLPAERLLKLCQAIELQQKRVRTQKWGTRTVDIDILFYGDLKIHLPGLTIPHPRINERDFVLVPLQKIK